MNLVNLPGNIPGTQLPTGDLILPTIVRSEGLSFQSVIEPETFRFVAQCLNQLRYCVSPKKLFHERN